VLKNEPLVIFS